ncbi:phosphatidylethanolamine-binding protein homolog F40A3.3-like isoform X2 [Tigriopus californicus]|uniref:phosphatidylethanolamine-binding protein homolog F40A3.3-like isoform X2 n=1 Tax=Tigriopus californicus TaxID=6832 RepID=UPI0027DAB3DF|nr:phosphatidylethanolamine-binding protein homolog F40A3.3-like isoform X2 [Tigriopus californicus]|eukprot:TCALIF_13066-PA protein Name:"Similar to F40A3.3 Phosphatidylethanolamine-binding protein homolog F40A3.3 (Caenorhabditis elegans)" AED:0.00 eAED:0.00 QI:75/1/1/1/0.66/0.75/4/37/281
MRHILHLLFCTYYWTLTESYEVRLERIRREEYDDFSRNYDNRVIGGVSRFGRPHGAILFGPNNLEGDWNQIWTQTRTVPEKLPAVPSGRANVRFPSGVSVRPNDTFTSGLLLQFPEIEWETEPNSMYTLMIVDVDIFRPESPVTNFIHYLSTNIPGSNIMAGDENFQFIPPFAFLYSPESGLVDDPNFSHRMVILIYKQRSRIETEIEQDYCSPTVFNRLQNLSDLVSKYRLGVPTAGNFLRVKYSSTTNKFLCKFSACTGSPFPAPLPGINDSPECQSYK